MTARDDYRLLAAWLNGYTVTGLNADLAETELARALDEIDRRRAQVDHYKGWFGSECRCDDAECPL